MSRIFSELSNPDEWLYIPEFGVMPGDVDFEGFSFHIYGPREDYSRGESLMSLISTARRLVRAQFKKMADFKKAEDEVLELITEGGSSRDDAIVDQAIESMTAAQSTAYLYATVMAELKFVIWRSEDDKERLDVLTLAAGTLATWADHGPQETSKRISKKNSENGSMSRLNARAADHDEIRIEHLRLVKEGHTERQARGILVSRGDMGSQSTIHRATTKK